VNKKNKILFIGSLPPPYHGSSVYFENLINHPLIKSEFSVFSLNTSDSRSDLDNLGRFDYMNVKTAVKNLFQFYKICRKQKPDLIYINTPQGIAYIREGLFVLISKLFFKSRIIQHLHGSEFLNFYSKANIFMRYFISISQKKIDYSIVLGEKLKHIFIKWQKSENIISLPNGIQSEVTYKGRNVNNRLPILFFFGNLLKFKGLFLSLEVLEIIKKDYPDIKLNVAGKWGHDWYFNLSQEKVKEEFYRMVDEKNLNSNVNFIGSVYHENKINLLENSDILLYPTYIDGFPLVLLDAMSAGCPIVSAGTVGAIPEVVVDGETGFLINNYIAKNYAEAVIKILKDRKLFYYMSLNARKRFEEKYTLDINIRNIVSIFNGVINNSWNKEVI